MIATAGENIKSDITKAIATYVTELDRLPEQHWDAMDRGPKPSERI